MPKRGFIICIIILVAMLAGSIVYFNRIQESHDSVIPMLKLHDTGKKTNGLKLVSDDYGPYVIARKVDGIEVSQNPKGFCSEVVTAVLNRMNAKIQSNILYPWARAVHSVKTGKADVVYGILRNRKREKTLFFAEETLCEYEVKLIICSNRARKFKFDSVEDLKGLRIAVMKGAHYPGEFVSYCKSNCKFLQVISISQIYRLLRSKRIDIAVMTKEEFKMYETQYRDQGRFEVLEKSLFRSPLYVAFCKKTVSQKFVERFSRALKSFKQTAEFKEICERYGIALPSDKDDEEKASTKFAPGIIKDSNTLY